MQPLLERQRQLTKNCTDIMINIHKNAARRRRRRIRRARTTYVMGANIAGFRKVADAMIAQGVLLALPSKQQ